MEYKTGTLVEFRDRPWVVQQSGDNDLMTIKPLGGTDAETVTLYLPLYEGKLDSVHTISVVRLPMMWGETAIRLLPAFFTMPAACPFGI